MEQKLLNADDLANLLQVNRQRIYELVRNQKIPFIRIGERQYRFASTAIEKWIEAGGSSPRTEGKGDERYAAE